MNLCEKLYVNIHIYIFVGTYLVKCVKNFHRMYKSTNTISILFVS